MKLGDTVALFRPRGTLAQVAPPQELLAAPVDDYVAGFVGFDRGIRRLSFVTTGGLHLSPAPALPANATVAQARAGGGWVLVTEAGSGRPLGWADPATLARLAGETPLGEAGTEPFGHGFTVGADSLRAALDAAVLSPAGLAVGVDGTGRVAGVATFDQLRAAIQADASHTGGASQAGGAGEPPMAARQEEPRP